MSNYLYHTCNKCDTVVIAQVRPETKASCKYLRVMLTFWQHDWSKTQQQSIKEEFTVQRCVNTVKNLTLFSEK